MEGVCSMCVCGGGGGGGGGRQETGDGGCLQLVWGVDRKQVMEGVCSLCVCVCGGERGNRWTAVYLLILEQLWQ